MLDWFKALANIFNSFVKMLFDLPFYGGVTFGYVLLAVYVIALILIYVGGKFK